EEAQALTGVSAGPPSCRRSAEGRGSEPRRQGAAPGPGLLQRVEGEQVEAAQVLVRAREALSGRQVAAAFLAAPGPGGRGGGVACDHEDAVGPGLVKLGYDVVQVLLVSDQAGRDVRGHRVAVPGEAADDGTWARARPGRDATSDVVRLTQLHGPGPL